MVEKIDSPIGDENSFAFQLITVHRYCRENRFPDRGREHFINFRVIFHYTSVEKIDSPIGDENKGQRLLLFQVRVEKIDSPIGDENAHHKQDQCIQLLVEKIDSPIGDENTAKVFQKHFSNP